MIYISIGSNLGHRLNYLRQAVDLLTERYLRNAKCSIVLETESILPLNAPLTWNKPFLNMIVAGESDLSPELLLQGLKKIEHEIGREQQSERWSPRVIDLDILVWDGVIINTPNLKIPHSELNNRPFLIHLLAMMGKGHGAIITPQNCFLNSFTLSPKLVGVVNITPDSFSDGGLFTDIDRATEQVIKLASQGAQIVEIGAQSTRPNAFIQSPEQEYSRLEPILDNLKSLMQMGEILISIDTFWAEIIHKILKKYQISWINDVKNDLDDSTLKLIAQRDCNVCIMHSLGIPPKKNVILDSDIPVIDTIINWATKNIERLLTLGFRKESIIIDPGIGFGKSSYQSIEILQHLELLKGLGSQVLIGHSRKSYMEAFSIKSAKERDLETIAISASIANKADFLRVHNVEDHMRFFVAKYSVKVG